MWLDRFTYVQGLPMHTLVPVFEEHGCNSVLIGWHCFALHLIMPGPCFLPRISRSSRAWLLRTESKARRKQASDHARAFARVSADHRFQCMCPLCSAVSHLPSDEECEDLIALSFAGVVPHLSGNTTCDDGEYAIRTKLLSGQLSFVHYAQKF